MLEKKLGRSNLTLGRNNISSMASNRLISAGLDSFLSHTEKSCYQFFSPEGPKAKAKKMVSNVLFFYFVIRGKLPIRCDK